MVRSTLVAAALLAGALTTPPARAAAPQPAPVTVPAVRSWEAAPGTWELTSATRIVAGQGLTDVAGMLADDLAGQEGVRPKVVSGGTARTHDIKLTLGGAAPGGSPEGYELKLADAASVTAADRRGVLYGTRTLLQALRTGARPGTVARGTVRDWPTHRERGQMLDAGRRYFPVDYLKQQVRQLAWYKLNTFHLHLSDWNGYRIESKRYPEIVAKDHYTKAQLQDLERYAARYGVTIVPEIDLPAHAVAIGDARPDLAFTCPSMSRPANNWEGSDRGHWTLDYTKPRTREFARTLIGEVADIFRGPYIHVGTDEVPLTPAQEACPELVAYQRAKGYPQVGDVLVEFINELDTAVRGKGRTTQIWEWWDHKQKTTIAPDKRIVVNEWKGAPGGRAAQGYRTVGMEDGPLYVSPGFGGVPGAYGFFDVRTTYRDYPFASAPGILGYRVARWSDRTRGMSLDELDFFGRRPLAVVADRTWATGAGSDVRGFLDRYDRVGDAAGPGLLSQAGWSASASSQETSGEPGAAGRAVDNDPYTHWHSAYGGSLPQQLTVDMGGVRRIAGVRYLPRQDGGVNGRVKSYEVLTSADGRRWGRAASGVFPAGPAESVVRFAAVGVRYVALRVVSEYGSEGRFASVGELDAVAGTRG
ncbi:hypothetical protein SRB5_70890 [Streptomyces sp. RB5]|uniref:beta-N-acetylhexosaminidase n=1 Tax=Streptomyces smaragdinus TaxID=2585196 RepID=A0A7K0CTR9_9ACTN|nr:family 20 glycosylhydrolase [Streptomyces smaragdinus]MQY16886.1 hypothetical protein [Streptomyces smaragdinus]